MWVNIVLIRYGPLKLPIESIDVVRTNEGDI